MKTILLKCNDILAAFIMFLTIGTAAYSATYYVDGNLAVDCDGTSYHYDVVTRTRVAGPGQIAWQHMNNANTTLVAGDICYIRGGTYTFVYANNEDAIAPVNSGSAGSPITFANYNNEDVVFEKGRYAINLNCNPPRNGTVTKRRYIKISGSPGHLMTFNNFYRQLWILDTDHDEIAYCTFFEGRVEGADAQGTYIYINANRNWIHDCKFLRWGTCEPYGTDAGGPFQMGINDADDHGTQYNLVENNEMAYGGHHVAWLGGTYNIYRNNYFHNEPWCPTSSPTFATRILIQNGYAAGGDNIDGIHNLNEGNRIGYGGPKNKSESGGNTVMVMGEWNTWRYNVWAQAYLSSVWLHCYNDYGEVTKYNHVYNNNFWKGGYGYYQDYYDPRATAPTNNWGKSFHHPVNIENDVTVASNTFKNNLFYQNNTSGNYTLGGYYDFVTEGGDYYYSVGPDRQNISNNWTDDLGDPKFTDISAVANPIIDPITLWNFNLQSSSTAIDGGTYLATANGAGNNSTSLVLNTEVKDAYPASLFFYDAGHIASAWPTANVNSDWIAIGTVSNVVQISSINYATNTITLVSPKTWSNNAPVWLYKKSDGKVVLFGNAPDYGAHEYVPGIALNSPTGGEIWVRGFIHAVTWSSNEVTDPVKIELIKSGSTTVLANNISVADRSYAWSILNSQTPGNDYTIKISAGTYEDTSEPFAISASAAPIVITLPVQSYASSSASLLGTVNPMGSGTTYYFEYGPTTAYGSKTEETILPAGDQGMPVQAALSGLSANTTYHFRLVAINDQGTTQGADLTFTTLNGGSNSGGDAGGGGGGGGCFISAVQGPNFWFMVLGLMAGWAVWTIRRARSFKKATICTPARHFEECNDEKSHIGV